MAKILSEELRKPPGLTISAAAVQAIESHLENPFEATQESVVVEPIVVAVTEEAMAEDLYKTTAVMGGWQVDPKALEKITVGEPVAGGKTAWQILQESKPQTAIELIEKLLKAEKRKEYLKLKARERRARNKVEKDSKKSKRARQKQKGCK